MSMALTSDQSWNGDNGGLSSHGSGVVIPSFTCSPNASLLSCPDFTNMAGKKEECMFPAFQTITGPPTFCLESKCEAPDNAMIYGKVLTASTGRTEEADGKWLGASGRDTNPEENPEVLVASSAAPEMPQLKESADENKDEASEFGGRVASEDVLVVKEQHLLSGQCSNHQERKSTGSVPSELISQVGPPPPQPPASSKELPPCPTWSKRKKRECDQLDEGEVESKFTKKPKSSTVVEDGAAPDDCIISRDCCSSPDVSIIVAAGEASVEGGESWQHQHHPVPDEGQQQQYPEGYGEDCSWDDSADELQMLCDDFGFELPEQQCSSCSKEGGAGDSVSTGSARHSRRQKIKATMRMLREAIPGGDGMDVSIVLDEAIHYVKLLQLQVQTLGAKRRADRAATG